MKPLGLLTTSLLLTVSLAVYSRNLPVRMTSLQHYAVALFNGSSVSVRQGFQQSLHRLLDRTKNPPFSRMTKESDP
jgi:hypothetical protein